jgi:hypothetical protein
LLLGDAQFARREIERVLETRRELGDVIQEAEDLRVLAGALAAMEQTADAARMLCDVIERAEEHGRPLLAAQAERDLAWLLHRAGRPSESTEAARKARVRFNQLRAEAEAKKLEELLTAAATTRCQPRRGISTAPLRPHRACNHTSNDGKPDPVAPFVPAWIKAAQAGSASTPPKFLSHKHLAGHRAELRGVPSSSSEFAQ